MPNVALLTIAARRGDITLIREAMNEKRPPC